MIQLWLFLQKAEQEKRLVQDAAMQVAKERIQAIGNNMLYR